MKGKKENLPPLNLGHIPTHDVCKQTNKKKRMTKDFKATTSTAEKERKKTRHTHTTLMRKHWPTKHIKVDWTTVDRCL